MKTYIFNHKNSSISVVITANSEEEALKELEQFGCSSDFINQLRLQEIEDEFEEETDI